MMEFTSKLLTITLRTRKMVIFDPEDIEYYDDESQVMFSEPKPVEDSYILLEDQQTKIELRLPDMEPVFDAVVEAVDVVLEPVKRAWASIFSPVASLAMPRIM